MRSEIEIKKEIRGLNREIRELKNQENHFFYRDGKEYKLFDKDSKEITIELLERVRNALQWTIDDEE